MVMAQAKVRQRSDNTDNDPGGRDLELIRKGLTALEAGDHETMAECVSQLHMDVDDLVYLKRVLGPDCFARHNIDTTVAEQKYGRDWLDRDI